MEIKIPIKSHVVLLHESGFSNKYTNNNENTNNNNKI